MHVRACPKEEAPSCLQQGVAPTFHDRSSECGARSNRESGSRIERPSIDLQTQDSLFCKISFVALLRCFRLVLRHARTTKFHFRIGYDWFEPVHLMFVSLQGESFSEGSIAAFSVEWYCLRVHRTRLRARPRPCAGRRQLKNRAVFLALICMLFSFSHRGIGRFLIA